MAQDLHGPAGHDDHSHGQNHAQDHGHDHGQDHSHDHGQGNAPKSKPSPWGWVPASLLLTGLLTFAHMPMVAYQGAQAAQEMQFVEPKTIAETEVLNAVKEALKNRFTAIVKNDPKILEKSFGQNGNTDALEEEQLILGNISKQVRASFKGDPQVQVTPYKIDVNGNRAEVVFDYMVTVGDKKVPGGHAWDLQKTKEGWKVVGSGSFVDSPQTSKVVSAAKGFLTDLKFGRKEAIDGPWAKKSDPLEAVTDKTIKDLAGKGGSWEVSNVTLRDLMSPQPIGQAQDASGAQLIVRNADTQERYLLVMANVRHGNGVMASQGWQVIGFASIKGLLHP
ncbi:hypothetical protein H1S01_17150 [Heliobacterium chlorum]|uniref:Nuclear transport factor 2 family protein n=1 Tax=Heliobacterium chlorum TaxID=2698 RepID=A0ABR7T5Y9_HELCL|nr:hypothetical protein [Heliobacterium chlorum]MBC9786194.1 hypothetical protein [Heliobacterium chlorum]